MYGKIRPHFFRRPFRFEAAWLLDNSFNDLVNASRCGDSITDCIKHFTTATINLNKNIFGNIFRKKRWTLARIEGIQKAQETKISHDLQCLKKELSTDYNNILAQEEIHWYQKSRAKWITQGERNTRYFHLTSISRRRANISMLKKQQ